MDDQTPEYQRWIREGEFLIKQLPFTYRAVFKMGHWWADRPWRKDRPNYG